MFQNEHALKFTQPDKPHSLPSVHKW